MSSRVRHLDEITIANNKSDDEFVRDYIESSFPDWHTWVDPRTSAHYTLRLVGSPTLPPAMLEACLAMVEHTSGADYRASTEGWSPGNKRREMREAALRYILVEEEETLVSSALPNDVSRGGLCGFMSMMPTYEEGEPVLYCYEIHLKEELRGTGFGTRLMNLLIGAAKKLSPPVRKVMLTCFVSNTVAFTFYRRHGFEPDPISPGPRVLRGKVFEPDHVILSLAVGESA